MSDSFTHENHVIIVFDLLGQNLYDYIQSAKLNKKSKTVVDRQMRVHITRQICQGLNYVKQKGIIHCDIKLENIIFENEEKGSVKLIDFGTSCENYSSGFAYVQSRPYRAPEVVFRQEYDHAIDMWSVGCVHYELITGASLFDAQDKNR